MPTCAPSPTVTRPARRSAGRDVGVRAYAAVVLDDRRRVDDHAGADLRSAFTTASGEDLRSGADLGVQERRLAVACTMGGNSKPASRRRSNTRRRPELSVVPPTPTNACRTPSLRKPSKLSAAETT